MRERLMAAPFFASCLRTSRKGSLAIIRYLIYKQPYIPYHSREESAKVSGHLKPTTTVLKGSCIVVLLSPYSNSPGHAQLQPDPGAENAEAYQAVLDDLESHRIDLNSAAVGDLESLPGSGVPR
tara:strand:+ start:503 stop:874 length:372 start_codon:yes stop_codon:yes gene_type:complete